MNSVRNLSSEKKETYNTSSKRLFEESGDFLLPQSLNPKKKRRHIAGSTLESPDHVVCDKPNPHDVLCGRGGLINKHPGNVAYRRVVESNKKTYHSCKKTYKNLLAISIVEAVARQNPPGRFLARDSSGLWLNIGRARAIQKTSQALREGAVRIKKAIEEKDNPSSNGPQEEQQQQQQQEESTSSNLNTQVTQEMSSCSARVERDSERSTSPPPPEMNPITERRVVSPVPSRVQYHANQNLEELDELSIFSNEEIFEELAALDGFSDLLSCDQSDPTEPLPFTPVVDTTTRQEHEDKSDMTDFSLSSSDFLMLSKFDSFADDTSVVSLESIPRDDHESSPSMDSASFEGIFLYAL